MNFRKFRAEDAEFCFRIRSSAYTQEFKRELTPLELKAGISAYQPADYTEIAMKTEFFIVEKDDQSVGFFILKRVDETTAEIFLIYLDLHCLGQGIGRSCIRFIEDWMAEHWTEVKILFVDTIIPDYNAGFYVKMGFIPSGNVKCVFQDTQVDALRLKKKLRPSQKNLSKF